MIDPGTFDIDPWSIIEASVDLDRLPKTETIFALSNGHIGLRGNLDEGEPQGTPGSYLNGFYECLPLPYAEAGYGYPEQNQTVLNVTNGKLMRLLVDDEPFDLRYGTVNRHRRILDLRAGTLTREIEWISPIGQAVRIRSTRLVSFVQRAIAAVNYEVEAIGTPARIVLLSSMIANEPMPEESGDPRAAAALRNPLVSDYFRHHDLSVALGHHTRSSGLTMAVGLDHEYSCLPTVDIEGESEPDLARVSFSTELAPGQTLQVVKYLAYGWSSRRTTAALRDQVDAALAAAKRSGWDGLLAGQRAFLDDIWEHSDVEIDGDPELQQAVRFAIFQVVQAAARAERRAIPAKGLTSRGYDGHSFWDMDTYALPVLTYSLPDAAKDALLWRHSILPLARDRAKQLRLSGATFPWRTIRGEECSGYWPAGTAAFHINADVADAVRRYVAATDDTDFERGPGLEILVETARLWQSLGHVDGQGRFRIDGVTGPDEYTAVVDNNVFTNLMAARNLRVAADVAQRYPDRAAEMDVSADEIADWRFDAEHVLIPFDDGLGVTAQSDGFTHYRRWDFAGTEANLYPLMLNFPYYLLYSSQVSKQADLVFALYLCGEHFSPEQKRADFEYYEGITVRDSSLSAAIQAIVAAEVGHLDLAYQYFRETALVDLHDLAGNTEDGVHLAAQAGAVLVAMAGFGGLRDSGDCLAFAPRLPDALDRIAFRMRYRGRSLGVAITPGQATYHLLSGDPLDITHHGEALTLAPCTPIDCPCPPAPNIPPVSPPPGRAPGERHAELPINPPG